MATTPAMRPQCSARRPTPWRAASCFRPMPMLLIAAAEASQALKQERRQDRSWPCPTVSYGQRPVHRLHLRGASSYGASQCGGIIASPATSGLLGAMARWRSQLAGGALSEPGPASSSSSCGRCLGHRR